MPITKLSLKEIKNSNKPWLTKGILKSINQKMLFTGNLLEPKIFIVKRGNSRTPKNMGKLRDSSTAENIKRISLQIL